MNETSKMLNRIVKDKGNYVSASKAFDCLGEMFKLEDENRKFKKALEEIESVSRKHTNLASKNYVINDVHEIANQALKDGEE